MRIAPLTKFGTRTPFIGRDRERALISDELRRGTRLVTLTGLSGIGKTRLARHVAAELAATFLDQGGTWFCSLAGCQTPSDVEGEVARTLGIFQKHGEALSLALAERGPTLLILDNVDSISGQLERVVGSWMDLCIELQILATSIVPTAIEGEVRIEVGPMEPRDAKTLYLDRAHRAWGGRTFSATEEPVVDELMSRLDRIPLAIELAAARIRVMPPQTLLDRFGKRFDLLRSGKGRHSSLLQALQLTWELLSEEEQRTLSRASVFEGGFPYAAAIDVLGVDTEEGDTLDLLDGLRSKALLQIDDADPPRFHLFESVKEYARLELERTGELDACLRDHTSYFLREGELHLAGIEGKGARESTHWLKSERQNLLAVHLRNLEHAPALAAQAGLVLASVLVMEEHPPSESHLAESVLDAALRSEDQALIVRALETRANALRQIGKAEEGLRALEDALERARESGDRRQEGHLLVQIVSLRMRLGVSAEDLLPVAAEAARLGREAGSALVEGMSLLVHGECQIDLQRFDEAEGYLSRSLAIFRQAGLLKRESLALICLGVIRNGQGRLRDARRSLQEALELGRETGSRRHEANALTNLGWVNLEAGFLDEAEASFEEALELLRILGNRGSGAIVQGSLGLVALERYDLELAERLLTESEGTLLETGARTFRFEFLAYLVVLDARRGRTQEARRSLARAHEYFSSLDRAELITRLRLIEGMIEIAEARARASADPSAAEKLVQQARARLEAQPASLEASVVLSIARRLLEQDLELWMAGLRESGEPDPASRLVVGPEANWFEISGKPRVDLQRRVSIRRLLDALAEKRLSAPGEPIGPFDLFDVGWTETLPSEIAMKRVYFGIWTLRDLGLSGVLLHQTDGYFLDPQVPLLRQR